MSDIEVTDPLKLIGAAKTTEGMAKKQTKLQTRTFRRKYKVHIRWFIKQLTREKNHKLGSWNM